MPYERYNEEDSKERCAVSGELCVGICRDQHLEEFGLKCPAWFTDEMLRRKKRRTRR